MRGRAIVRSMGMLLVALFGGRSVRAAEAPNAKQTPPPVHEPLRLHPFVAVGGIVGHARERRGCYDEGAYQCPSANDIVSLGLQAAPFAEGTVMAGKSQGFRFGLGLRYVAPVLLDEGGELHFAIVPEIVSELGKGTKVSGRFFNAFMLTFPSPESKARQTKVDQCGLGPEPAGASCDENGDLSRFGLGLALELFVHQELDGTTVRYGIGFQSIIMQNVSHGTAYSGSNPDDAPDSLSYSSSVESNRFVALAGVEW